MDNIIIQVKTVGGENDKLKTHRSGKKTKYGYDEFGNIECYFNQDGFYDDKWEMRYPHIVLEELKKFNEKLLDTKDEEIIKKSKEVIEQLVF